MSLLKLRISAKGFFFNADNQVLLIRGRKSQLSDGYWSAPGGGVEDGENIFAAAERELLEETGYRTESEKIVFAQDYLNPDHGRNFEIFVTGRVLDLPKVTAIDDVECKFFSQAEFQKIKFRPSGIDPFTLLEGCNASYRTYLGSLKEMPAEDAEPFKMRISAKALLFTADQRVLLVKGKTSHHSQAFWCAPGGGVEEGESIYSAAEREIVEETGYFGKAEKIAFVQDFQYQDSGRNLEVFTIGTVDESKQPRSDCDHEPRFFTEQEFKNIIYLPEGINPFEIRNNHVDYKTFLVSPEK